VFENTVLRRIIESKRDEETGEWRKLREEFTDVTNSKELSVVIHTAKHNYITSIITMRVLTTTCFGPTCGPSSGCNLTRSVIL